MRFAVDPQTKKSPDRYESIRGFPFFILKIVGKPLSAKIADPFAQAGLLTLGSPYLPPLPISGSAYCRTPDSGYLRLSSPITAAGPSPILTGFPYKPC